MLVIKNKNICVPIIQGGMGIGVSLGKLAGAVAKCGGIGVVSSVNAGYKEEDFYCNPRLANERALKNEISMAKRISENNGMVAVNIMMAVSSYEESVRTAIKAGADAIISGAGLPLDLPRLRAEMNSTEVALAPIVSSGKAANIICKYWDKKYNVIPDFLVIEGPMAGGHLGFSKQEIIDGTAMQVDDILPDVLSVIKKYEDKYDKKIPVFVAGGVYDNSDIKRLISKGASGVQIATRFIATYECDASQEYKDVMINAKDEDITIVPSPVGMPGRALKTPMIEKIFSGKCFPPVKCNACVKTCPGADKIPYCISRALIAAVEGNLEDGLFFCGANVGKIDRMMSVKELIDELMDGLELRKCS